MCSGGGGASKAKITDPLKRSKESKQAQKSVDKIEKRYRKGKLTPEQYQQQITAAKERLAQADKYEDDSSSTVEKNVQFVVGKLDEMFSKNNKLNLTQELVNASNQGLQQTLQTLNQLSTMAADNQRLLQEDAARLSALKGAPPPEKSADAPVIGRNRDGAARPGRTRQSLRIDRTPSNNLAIY